MFKLLLALPLISAISVNQLGAGIGSMVTKRQEKKRQLLMEYDRLLEIEEQRRALENSKETISKSTFKKLEESFDQKINESK